MSYHQQMSTLLSSLSDVSLSSSSILQSQNKSLQQILQRLCLLSIVPSSFAVSFGIILNNTTSQKSPRLIHALSADVPLPLSPTKVLSSSSISQSISTSNRRLSLQFTSTETSEPIYEEIKVHTHIGHYRNIMYLYFIKIYCSCTYMSHCITYTTYYVVCIIILFEFIYSLF